MLELNFRLVFCDVYVDNCDARQVDFQVRQKSREGDLAQAQGFPEPSNWFALCS